ncbi:MAG TPA: SMR family transporter [Bacillota bacterium]|nr:SMR family transporter [Bacillota bacterium]
MKKYWVTLFVAAVLEVFWVIGLAHAYDVWTWIVTLILIVVSNYLMIMVAQKLPAGTVYTVFVGLGAGGTVVADMLFFGGVFIWVKILLITALLFGVIGLKLVTDKEATERRRV